MREVVAKKANLLPGYIICMIIGAVLLIGGIVLGIKAQETGAIFVGVVIGLLLIVTGAICTLLYVRAPKEYIVYEGDKLHFADGSECYPHEVTHVLVKITRRNGIASPTGGIVLTVGDRKIEYKNVDKVRGVQLRLEELFEYSKNAAINAQQAQWQAQQSANAQTANAQGEVAKPDSDDPFGM